MKKIFENIKENYKLVLIVLGIGLILGWLIFHQSAESPMVNESVDSHEGHDHEEASTIWTCSMHPQIKQDEPGQCPICAMDLIPLESMESGENIDPNEISLSEAAIKLAAIQTTTVKKAKAVKQVYLQGKVTADERKIAELTARFNGRIEKLYVNYTGQKVSKGQKLASIYSPELLTAQRELIEASALKNSRPALYNSAKLKLKLWDLTDPQIEAIETSGDPIVSFDILSPVSGTVTMRHVATGDYVKEGQALFKIIDLSKVWVQFDAYERDLPWIKTGDSIQIKVNGLSTYSSKVVFIDPFVNDKSRVAQVRTELSNKNGELKPGMFASGVLKSKLNNEAVLIPKSAVLWTGKRSVVYVKVPDRESSSFLYREVVLGPETDDMYMLEDGLVEGEEIAVNGVFKIDAAAQLNGKLSMMNQLESKSDDMAGMNMEELKTFTVAGNCGMCKDRIEEAALSVSGVSFAEWNSETQQVKVKLKDGVKLMDVQKAIAKVGHDTEMGKADDEVYKNLPECCLYERLSYTNPVAEQLQHAMFTVAGNCGMCKDRIEEAANSVKGVKSAEWNADKQMLHLEYSGDKTLIDEVQKAVAKVGHDTEKYKADDEVYKNLPECCLYERIK